MAEVTNELIYEALKSIQPRLSNIEMGMTETRTELRALRNHMLAMQTDIANLYVGQGNIEARLGCIERRLEPSDALAT